MSKLDQRTLKIDVVVYFWSTSL